jgi:signal peptidase I
MTSTPIIETVVSQQTVREKVNPTLLSEIKDYLFYFIKVFVIVALTYILIRTFVFDVVGISGFSMNPNYDDHDTIYLDQITPQFSEYHRGDVVVLLPPDKKAPRPLYIKRVIGLPGERIIIEEGLVKVVTKKGEEVQLQEIYLPKNTLTYKGIQSGTERFEETILGTDEYFVMGDNRTGSSDSRIFGSVKKRNILGKEFYRAYPADKVGFFKRPVYNLTD